MILKMTRILVTGNSGYIGSHLCQLLNKNKDIIIHGLDKNDPIISVDKFYKQNILDIHSIDDEYDCVIHLAAEVSVGESVRDPIKYYNTNVVGTLNVLKKIKTKRLVIASTGAAEQLNSPYGLSKRAMEEIVFQHCNETNIPVTVFRFYNVVGSDGIPPTNPDGLFYALINAVTTKTFTIFGDDYNTKDGTCVRDYCHVNEICNALEAAIATSTNKIENLGHGVGTTVKEMLELFKDVNNVDFKVNLGPRRDGDLEYSVLSNPSKFMKKLYSINDLLKVTI
jgi:UDP-glucose 4-epimerase